MSFPCPFHWREHPRDSIFMEDKSFTYGAGSGKSMSHISSESVERITKRTGRNPGTIGGISSHADRLMEESQHRLRQTTKETA